ncbi:MAG: hypothetical protein IPL72_17310 [Sulfuritalea sp.]|nr:hypothetical protein [Sulfuritalea sp.]
MTASSSATSTANGRQRRILAITFYYPFIDTDAVGEELTLTTATIPGMRAGA